MRRNFINSKLFILAMVILCVFFVNLKYKQYKQQKLIETEKNSLTKQIQELESKNSVLSQSLSYLDTLEFKEKLARQQLNLKRKEEQVFNFSEKLTSDNPLGLEMQKQQKSNFQKWWEYFIKTNNWHYADPVKKNSKIFIFFGDCSGHH